LHTGQQRDDASSHYRLPAPRHRALLMYENTSQKREKKKKKKKVSTQRAADGALKWQKMQKEDG